MAETVVAAVLLGIVGLAGVGLVRNVQVYREQMRVLDLLHEAAQCDIRAGRAWEWRYALFNQVRYEAMAWRFWRPIDSFYDPAIWRPQGNAGG